MLFCCPKCKSRLVRDGMTYRCAHGHTFDLARQGYLNLLCSNNRTAHGDQNIMLTARRRFLDAGYYHIFADKLSELVAEHITTDSDIVLDCGCGEGYYTGYLHSKLPHNPIAGFDVSKKAVAMAAAKYEGIDFAVASSSDIPLPDHFVKNLTNVFSPMKEDEFSRVLQNDGVLIYAVPGVHHLWGLKQLIYDNPYPNEVCNTEYGGFALCDRVSVADEITLPSDALLDLFAMTPYYYRSPRSAIEKIESVDSLKTDIAFDFLIYRKSH